MKRQSDRAFQRCHWCSRIIVWWKKLPEASILNEQTKDGGYVFPRGIVTFRKGGIEHQLPFVTVDHLVELYKGGTNDPQNLVLSCPDCNSQRSLSPLRPCSDCQTASRMRSYSYCLACLIERFKTHLRSRGLEVGRDIPLEYIERHFTEREESVLASK